MNYFKVPRVIVCTASKQHPSLRKTLALAAVATPVSRQEPLRTEMRGRGGARGWEEKKVKTTVFKATHVRLILFPRSLVMK